jgi:hypothetical protein
MKGWNELFQRCSGTGMTWNTPASINICVYTAFGFYRFEFSFTLVFLSYTCERVYIELNCMIKLVTVCQKDGRMRMTLKKRHALRLGICWFATTPNFTLQLNLKPLLFRLNENVCVSFSRHSFITPAGHRRIHNKTEQNETFWTVDNFDFIFQFIICFNASSYQFILEVAVKFFGHNGITAWVKCLDSISGNNFCFISS